jgi:plastocyanin
MNQAPMMLALALCGALAGTSPLAAEEASPVPAAPVVAEVEADGVQRATIILDSYSFAPNHLIVQAGKPVELTLTRATLITPHNFLLKAPDAGLDIEEEVGHGEPTTVRFTPMTPGTFTFYCDRKLLFFKSHREEGMEGRLEVR